MSASREKKQRQGAGPSEKAAQAQQGQAAYQRKVRTYTAIGVVVVVLVAALLIWNSGIFQSRATAATVGDTDYTVADVSYFYRSAWLNTYQWYYQYGLSSYIPAEDAVANSETGETYRDQFMDQALTLMTNITALYDAAIADGYSASDVADDVQATIDTTKASASYYGYSYASYLKANYGRYMSKSAYESILTRVAIANAYATAHQDSLTYDDDAIQAYYEENKDTLDTFEYSYLYFTPAAIETKDEDGNDLELTDEEEAALKEEALADAKEKAEAALAAIEDGGDIADVIEEYEPTSSADHTTTVGSSLSSTYKEELIGYKDGEAGLVENGTSGYYVVVRHSRYLNETPNADVYHILISAETTTDEDGKTVEPTDEAWAAAKEQAEAVLAEYEAGEQTAEAFAALAEKYSDDKDSDGNLNNGALYTNISPSDPYTTEFLDWIFGDEAPHSVGDTGIVRHEGDVSSSYAYWGYHIMYYAADNNPVWKNTVISTLTNDDMTAWQEELSSGYTAAFTNAANDLG